MNHKTLLIVGAGGFIGGFIAAKALELGYDTWVGIRASTSRRYLSDSRLHIVEFDYDNPDRLRTAISEKCPESGKWDFIIWNLGATKCANYADFNRINCVYLEDFVEVLIALGKTPDRFLFMSSLSALGPGDEKGYAPLTDRTIPNPNTRYGVSKIKAETYLQMVADRLNWIIFRPTGVYGPHEKDYLMMIKSIDNGFDVGMGYKKQMLTFIYVEDLVDAMFMALSAPTEKVIHKKFIISENRAYSQKEFRDIVSHYLHKKMVMPVKLPMWVVLAVSTVCEKIAVAKGKTSTLNRDKFKIMKQRNWNCDVSGAREAFGFTAQWSLQRGIEETVNAYIADKNGNKSKGRRS